MKKKYLYIMDYQEVVKHMMFIKIIKLKKYIELNMETQACGLTDMIHQYIKSFYLMNLLDKLNYKTY